jgi:hypothetical protein
MRPSHLGRLLVAPGLCRPALQLVAVLFWGCLSYQQHLHPLNQRVRTGTWTGTWCVSVRGPALDCGLDETLLLGHRDWPSGECQLAASGEFPEGP